MVKINNSIQLEPEDLPLPYYAERQRVVIKIPPTLVAEIDALIFEYKDQEPEICAYRSRFIETALRLFVRNFLTLTIAEWER